MMKRVDEPLEPNSRKIQTNIHGQNKRVMQQCRQWLTSLCLQQIAFSRSKLHLKYSERTNFSTMMVRVAVFGIMDTVTT